MNIEDLMRLYFDMKGRDYSPLGLMGGFSSQSTLQEFSIKAEGNSGAKSLNTQWLEKYSEEEKWIAAIYYCQGVIRNNLKGGSIHFRELDDGMEQLRKLTRVYQFPSSEFPPQDVACTFADANKDEWKEIYLASRSAQDELMLLAALNIRHNMPIPQAVRQLVANHLRKQEDPAVTERDKRRTKDRDTLFVILAKRVSDVTAGTTIGAKDSIKTSPLRFMGVTVVACAFTGLGIPIKPDRAARIWDENKSFCDQSDTISFRLEPDFSAARQKGGQSAKQQITRALIGYLVQSEEQMRKALEHYISPEWGIS